MTHSIRYRATRTALMRYEINGEHGAVASIALKNRLWPAEGAPLAPLLGEALVDYPSLTVNGIGYTAHRRLLTNRFFVNDYSVWLLNLSGKQMIRCFMPGKKWTSEIDYLDRKYSLTRQSVFGFGFELEGDGTSARFADTTNFLTFTSRRKFLLDAEQPVDHLLLSFAFFLATSVIFR